MAMGVENIWGKFDKATKLAILKLDYFTLKDFRETVQGPDVFITIFLLSMFDIWGFHY